MNGKPSWAAIVARNGSEDKTSQQAGLKQKVVLTKHFHEIIIRAPNQPVELANRALKEIIKAVKKASGIGYITASRRLLSGDMVIVFDGDIIILKESIN